VNHHLIRAMLSPELRRLIQGQAAVIRATSLSGLAPLAVAMRPLLHQANALFGHQPQPRLPLAPDAAPGADKTGE
jgi:hypothetical protein